MLLCTNRVPGPFSSEPLAEFVEEIRSWGWLVALHARVRKHPPPSRLGTVSMFRFDVLEEAAGGPVPRSLCYVTSTERSTPTQTSADRPDRPTRNRATRCEGPVVKRSILYFMVNVLHVLVVRVRVRVRVFDRGAVAGGLVARRWLVQMITCASV